MPRPKVKITYPKEGAEETYSDRHEPQPVLHTSKHIAGREHARDGRLPGVLLHLPAAAAERDRQAIQSGSRAHRRRRQPVPSQRICRLRPDVGRRRHPPEDFAAKAEELEERLAEVEEAQAEGDEAAAAALEDLTQPVDEAEVRRETP